MRTLTVLIHSMILLLFLYSGSHAANYVCGEDLNNDGYLDGENETAQCIETQQGQLCPIGSVDCTPYDVCPLGSQYSCTGSPPTCTAWQPCVTYDGATTGYQCGLTGTIYDTQAQCDDDCYESASCDTAYSCPLGDYACMDNSGTYQCSPNQCVDIEATPPEGNDYDDTSYQDDGVVDSLGNCLGEFFIFNGQPGQCRTVGTQTSFFNCCNNSDDQFLFIQKSCKEEEWQTNAAEDAGRCHSIGKYCKERWRFIGCVQKAEVYCCFNSKLARIIHEQGRPQLKSFGPDGGWGTTESPNCTGFTPEEFQMLDFSRIDLSEYFGDIQTPAAEDIKSNMENKINEFYQDIK